MLWNTRTRNNWTQIVLKAFYNQVLQRREFPAMVLVTGQFCPWHTMAFSAVATWEPEIPRKSRRCWLITSTWPVQSSNMPPSPPPHPRPPAEQQSPAHDPCLWVIWRLVSHDTAINKIIATFLSLTLIIYLWQLSLKSHKKIQQPFPFYFKKVLGILWGFFRSNKK